MDSARSTNSGPPAPMRVEVRLWDLEHALLLDPSSFELLREEVDLEHSSFLPNTDLVDRTKPAITVEVRFEHQVGAESRIHSPVASLSQPAVNWGHNPVRSNLAHAPIREVLVFSLHPIALEGLVEFRLYQWACLNDEQLAAVKQQQQFHSRVNSGNDDALCSVSEQDEAEHITNQATAKLCIGCLRVPLRSLLQMDQQVRLKLQLDASLRGEVQRYSDDVYDGIAGVAYGGIASLSCHVSAFFADCILPVPLPPSSRSPPRRPGGASASTVDANGLILTGRRGGREGSQESVMSSSSYSLLGVDTMELRLLLVPIRVLNDMMRVTLDVVLWKKPTTTIATILIVMFASLFELYHTLGVVLVVAGTVRCTRATRSAASKAIHSDYDAPNVVMLYPPQCATLNGIIRGDLWLSAGHSDEAFLEVVHLVRRLAQRAASLSVLLWVVAVVYIWTPIDVFVPVLTAFALLVYPISHTALYGIRLRRRTAGGGDVSLGPWEALLPKPYTTTPLPVTRIVKAYVPSAVLTRSSTMSPRGSSFRRELPDSTLPPQRSGSGPSDVATPPLLPPSTTSPGGPAPAAAFERQLTGATADVSGDITAGGTTQTFLSSDVEVSPDSPEHHRHVAERSKHLVVPGGDVHPPSVPRVPKLHLNLRDLPPPPQLSARAQRMSGSATGSHVSSERIETPRQRATPRHASQHHQEATDSIVPLPRGHSGMHLTSTSGPMAASVHRRTQSQLISAAPSFSYAVVTVEWRDEHMLDNGHAAVRNIYSANSALITVKERLKEFYQKLEAAEQRLLADSRHQQPSFVLESTGSVSSSAGLNATSKLSTQYAIHDQVVAEATRLLLSLRRLYKSAVVHVSTSSVSAADCGGAAVDRLERIANPNTIVENVSACQLTSALVSGFAQLPVVRLTSARGLDENCRAWALLCLCFLNGRRASLFAPPGQPKMTFLIPLLPHSLTFDLSGCGTASCPPPLGPALQDLWRGWKESKDSHGLVTVDMILTIISAHREYWKHPAVHNVPTGGTPMQPVASGAFSGVGPLGTTQISSSASRRASHQRPMINASPLRAGVQDDTTEVAAPQMTSAGSWVLVHNNLKSPIDAHSAGRVGSPPLAPPLAPLHHHQLTLHNSAHDAPILDYFANGGISASFESETSTSNRNRRNVYESLGLLSQKKERDSPEVSSRLMRPEDVHAAAAPSTPVPTTRGLSPAPKSPPQEAFPTFVDAKQPQDMPRSM